MKSLIEPGCMVFDIGANTGESAIRFISAGVKTIISVEPRLENVFLLRGIDGVIPILAAVGRQPCLKDIFRCTTLPGLSTLHREKWAALYPKAEWASNSDAVPVITLDMIEDHYWSPWAIKIDTEGNELDVLNGLSHKSPVLFFEFHWKLKQETMACMERLMALGYTRAHYVREEFDLETIPNTPIEEFVSRWLKDAPEWGNITVI